MRIGAEECPRPGCSPSGPALARTGRSTGHLCSAGVATCADQDGCLCRSRPSLPEEMLLAQRRLRPGLSATRPTPPPVAGHGVAGAADLSEGHEQRRVWPDRPSWSSVRAVRPTSRTVSRQHRRAACTPRRRPGAAHPRCSAARRGRRAHSGSRGVTTARCAKTSGRRPRGASGHAAAARAGAHRAAGLDVGIVNRRAR
jgi:hypothetical protein